MIRVFSLFLLKGLGETSYSGLRSILSYSLNNYLLSLIRVFLLEFLHPIIIPLYLGNFGLHPLLNFYYNNPHTLTFYSIYLIMNIFLMSAFMLAIKSNYYTLLWSFLWCCLIYNHPSHASMHQA